MDPGSEPSCSPVVYSGPLLCYSVSLHLKGTWETQNHKTFCMRLVLVSFTLIYSCMSISIEILHDQSSSEESLRDSKPPVTGSLRTMQGTGIMTSQCMKLVLVSFTLIYSATCALVLSFHIYVCVGYMCFVKL